MSKKLASVLSLVIVMVFAFFAVASTDDSSDSSDSSGSISSGSSSHSSSEDRKPTDRSEYVKYEGGAEVVEIIKQTDQITVRDQNGDDTSFVDHNNNYYIGQQVNVIIYYNGNITVYNSNATKRLGDFDILREPWENEGFVNGDSEGYWNTNR